MYNRLFTTKALNALNIRIQQYLSTEAPTSSTTASKRDAYYKKLGLQQQMDNEKPKDWNKALPYTKMPGPRSVPFLGSMYKFLPGGEFYRKSMMHFFQSLRAQFGDILLVKNIVGRNDMVQISKPEDCEFLLRNEGAWPIRNGNECITYYRKAIRADVFQGVGGILTTQGQEWFEFRSKVNPIMMQPRVTKQYVKPMDLVAGDLVKNIRHFARISEDMPENFVYELNKWSLESIAVIALEKRLGALNLNLEKDSPIHKYIKSVLEVMDLIFELDIQPSFYKYINTPTWKRFVELMDYITYTNLKYIEEAQERLEQKSESDTEPSVLKKLMKIDKKVALTMAMDMLIAGIDTTSKTLGATLYFLAKNPEKQTKLRTELLEKLPEKDSPVTKEMLEISPYLKAVIKETTRIVPIGVGAFRTTPKDIVLKGYQIPKGTDILAILLLESMSGRHFKRPTEFLPERWLKSSEGDEIYHKNVHPFVNLPFGFGPRSCIGKRLANLELEVGLAKIIRNFELTWKHDDMRFGGTILYGIIDPLKLTVKEISN